MPENLWLDSGQLGVTATPRCTSSRSIRHVCFACNFGRWRISARASRSSQGCALLLASLRRPLPLPFVSPIGRQLLACVPAWVI